MTSPRPAFAAAPWHRDRKTAIIYRNAGWDYAELAERAQDRADWLCGQGLAPGEAILVTDDPGPELVVMQHALARAGAAMLPVSPSLDAERRAALMAAAGVEWRWIAAAGQLLSTGIRTADGEGLPSPLALIIATSGSTGAPRAALITQENVLASCALINHRLGLEAGDHWLCCLPRDHVGGLSIGYRCALAGATLVLCDLFEADAVRTALDRHRITHLSLVPPMLARLLDLGAPPPRDLRVLLVGGQALHGSLAARAIADGWPLRLTYGMTETFSQIATSTQLRACPEPGVVGPPLPGVEVDCPGAGMAPAALRVRGPTLMAGYASQRRCAGLGLTAGWLTTADLGCWTRDGQLRIMGRADDALVIGGHQVFPLQVEGKLSQLEGVTAIVVIGLLEPVWGHSLAAAYVGTIDPERLERWCRENLPSPERPRRFRRFTQLPELPSGKHDRALIRAILTGP